MATETYRLKCPIEHGQGCIEEFEIREMELGDLEQWNLDSGAPLKMGAIIDLLGNLTGQPPSVIRKVKMPDLQPLMQIVKKYMPAGL